MESRVLQCYRVHLLLLDGHLRQTAGTDPQTSARKLWLCRQVTARASTASILLTAVRGDSMKLLQARFRREQSACKLLVDIFLPVGSMVKSVFPVSKKSSERLVKWLVRQLTQFSRKRNALPCELSIYFLYSVTLDV